MGTVTALPEKIELVYKLRGNVEEVSVFELAPALLGLGNLLVDANKALGNEFDVSVNVKPFGEGSFIADVVLYVHTHYPLLLPAAQAVQDFDKVLKAIGIVSSRSTSLIDAVKKLGGKVEKVEPISPNEYRLTSKDSSVIVNGDVGTLIQNPTIHQHIYPALGKPAEAPNVSSLETFIRGDENGTKVSHDKNEAKALQEFSESDIPEPLNVEEHERTTEYLLHPKRVSVEGEADNWSFRYGEKDVLKVDVVRDADFLHKIESGVYRPTHNDLLVADVKIIQRVSGNNIIGKKVELLKVKEYRLAPRPEQTSIQ